MESLVIANIKHRPMRVVATALGISIGTLFIMIVVGLAHGMINERNSRETNILAEIMVRPAGSFSAGVSSNTLSMPVENIRKVQEIAGVASVAPLGQFIQSTETGIGFRVIEAIEFDSYKQVSGINIISGTTAQSDDEVIVDEEYARNNKLRVGDNVKAFDRKFKLAGIYSPQVGARIKVRLSFLQNMLSSENMCTMLLVRCQKNSEQESIARLISEKIPDTQIILVRDLPKLYSKGLPALDLFLKVLIIVAVLISTVVILLAMYTAILERTREIGILKSLGASKRYIIWAIEKEALLIGFLGVVFGYFLAVVSRLLIVKLTTLKSIEFEIEWILITAVIGIASSLLGALYPAMKAAKQDPVEALSYE
ncbi:MAG: ABC transporter permease [Blastocatellia bacterium]|nr:ABC transporter permease [Blastocatellia bacterium]